MDFCEIIGQKANYENDFPENSLERAARELMHRIGVPAHVRGYHYLIDAVLLSADDRSVLDGITKVLYPTIARRFASTPQRVERSIRHAIAIAWERGDAELIVELFGNSNRYKKGRPSNGEFIAVISEKILFDNTAMYG